MIQRCKEDLMIALLCVTIISASGSTQNVTMSTIIEEMFTGYDKKLPPRYDKLPNERQVVVAVGIYIVSMFSVSEIDMEYSLSMYLRQRWVDERLTFNDTLNLTRIELALSMFNDVWTPDLFIPTEKSSNFHEVTVRNQMIHIYPDGTIQYSARVTGSYFCIMDLRKYPFDTQHCKLEMESYSFATDKLRFVWSENPLTLTKNIEFPQFELKETTTYQCDKDYYGIIYPCIGANFILERNYSYYIVQIYIPSILIVILSWVNFWLDCTSVPGRVSLALLTVLTMTTQSSGARANLPRVSYIKAIDVWMAVCLTFVFLGLVEFAYVNVQSRVQSRRKSIYIKRQTPPVQNGNAGGRHNSESHNSEDELDKDSEDECQLKLPCFKHLRGIERARAIDKVSRVLFPLSFIIFNIIYWSYYFKWAPDFEENVSS